MTDTSISGVPHVRRIERRKAPQITLPKPQPFGAPVFIADAVTPLFGETFLSLLMKRIAKENENGAD